MTKRDYTEQQKLVNHFDPNLRVIEIFLIMKNTVLKVQREGVDYIFKISNERDPVAYHSIVGEKKSLELASNVSGITHLVQEWIPRGAILKEFFPGDNLCSAERAREFLTHRRLYPQLRQTIYDLHNLDLAGVDFFETNIYMSPDRTEVKLIDLGGVVSRQDVSDEKFERALTYDIYRIEGFREYLKTFWRIYSYEDARKSGYNLKKLVEGKGTLE